MRRRTSVQPTSSQKGKKSSSSSTCPRMGRPQPSRTSRPRARMVLQILLALAGAQAIALLLLSWTFPAVPSASRAALEVLLIPLVPFARRGGRFKCEAFRRKWLFWPLTRARRLVTRTPLQSPTFRYVDVTDGKSTIVKELPPKPDGVIRYVAISDTHLLHGDIQLPEGDVLLHCGDILVADRGRSASDRGKRGIALLADFNKWVGKHAANFQHRLVTGGNHDGILEALLGNATSKNDFLSHATFVNGEDVTVSPGNGTNSRQGVYLSAASRGYRGGGSNAAFQYTHDFEAETIYSKIPSGIDVLVTHGPPQHILDATGSNEGCPVLRQHVQDRIRPRVHVFGHWHAAPRSTREGGTVYINAASVDYDYAATHSAVVFDLIT